MNENLTRKAQWVRRNVLDAAAAAGKGHLGGTFSCVDLLVALYYGGILNFRPSDPNWEDRDRFLIGKGHACLALYAIFMDLGMISAEKFHTYGLDNGLGGQLDISIPGAEYNTGSLGHVLGIAAGIALAADLDRKSYKAFAMMGDGECHEGAVWEAIIFAGQRKLNHLVGIIDRNRLSVTDVLDDDSFFEGFTSKVEAFGWDAYEINGHDIAEVISVFKKIQAASKPVMIIANTIKGKGVSFMENGVKWHHGVPNAQELEIAKKELSLG